MKTLLISLHPRHSQNILSSRKTIELRKKFPQDVKRVFFYETAPTQAIVGCFTVKETRLLKSIEWCDFHYELRLTHGEIKNYLKDKEGIGVFIENVQRTWWVNLEKMKEAGINPPQNYTYFSDEMIEKLGVKFNG